jgi:hypothetical protein
MVEACSTYGKKSVAYKVLFGKSEKKRPLGRFKSKEDIIKKGV